MSDADVNLAEGSLRPVLARGRWLLAGALLIGSALVLGMPIGVGMFAQRCQCQFTAVVAAQRSGYRTLHLDLHVREDQRRDLADELQAVGALADPGWVTGLLPDPPIVYVHPSREAAVLDLVARRRAVPTR